MAGRVAIQAVPFNSGLGALSGTLNGILPTAPSAGYDTGSPGGTFTAWSTNNSIYVPNNGQVILWYYCGAAGAGVTNVLVGDAIGNTGLYPPASTETVTLGATSYGYLGPWSPATYNIQNPSATYTGTIGGSIPAAAQGCVVVEFTTITNLSVRAYQLIPVQP